MKNTVLAFLICFSPIVLLSQEGIKLKKFNSAMASISYSKGDTLKAGFFEKNVFSKDQFYQNIYVKDKKNICGFSPCKVDISDSILTIKNIIQYTDHCVFGFQNATILEVEAKRSSYFVAIEKALLSKEVVAYKNTYVPKKSRPLDEVAVLMLNLNFLNANNEEYLIRYIRATNPEKAKIYNQNANLLQLEKQSWLTEMEKLRKEITVKDTFHFHVPVFIGKYAVDKNQFLIQDNPDGYGTKSILYSEDTKVQFDNFSSIWTLNSNRAKADFFMNATAPDYNGNRKAYLQVKAICTSVERNPKAGPVTPETKLVNVIHFKVLEINAVDSPHLIYNEIGYFRLP